MAKRSGTLIREIDPDRQYQPDVIRYHAGNTVLLLNIRRVHRNVSLMKNLAIISCIATLMAFAPPAMAAECYADYKAKRDNPLKLHYGVAEVRGACTKSAAKSEIRTRVSRDGWVLLNVMSVFDASGLAERKRSAGQFFLRY